MPGAEVIREEPEAAPEDFLRRFEDLEDSFSRGRFGELLEFELELFVSSSTTPLPAEEPEACNTEAVTSLTRS